MAGLKSNCAHLHPSYWSARYFWHPPIGKLFVLPVLNLSAIICSLPIGRLVFWHPPIGKLFVLPVLNLSAIICSLPIGRLVFWHPPIGELFVWPVLNISALICILPIGQPLLRQFLLVSSFCGTLLLVNFRS
jgi:hypothetical protein